MKFNIWDLEHVHVRVTTDFLNHINEEVFSKFKIKREAHKVIFNSNELPYATFRNLLKLSYSSEFFMPLDFLIKVCMKLDISLEELQRQIISYKSRGSINYIEGPYLPIEISPVFDMLYAHHIGDGTVSIAKDRLPYFAYRQFNLFYRQAYIDKIESIFGRIIYKKEEFKDTTRVRCPSVLSALFFKYYDLNDRSFLSDTARISEKIFSKGKDSMLAVLIAFIIDEGSIDSTEIVIKLKNHLLTADLKKICSVLEYENKLTYGSDNYRDYATLHILRKGMRKFYQDYLDLHNRYPVIHLGIKGEKIENSFNIYTRKIYKVKGNKENILSLLRSESLSVNQLASRLNMTRQGIRYHIHSLLKEDKIRIIDDSQLNWIYGV